MIIPRSTVLASCNVPAVSPIPFAALFSASLFSPSRYLFRISPSVYSGYLSDLCQDFGHEKSGVYATRNTSLGSDNALVSSLCLQLLDLNRELVSVGLGLCSIGDLALKLLDAGVLLGEKRLVILDVIVGYLRLLLRLRFLVLLPFRLLDLRLFAIYVLFHENCLSESCRQKPTL